jgi:hypothetical protein
MTSPDPPRRRFNVGAVKIPNWQRTIAHDVLPDDEAWAERGYRETSSARTVVPARADRTRHQRRAPVEGQPVAPTPAAAAAACTRSPTVAPTPAGRTGFVGV